MIYFKTNSKDDPYYDLWNSASWLFPFDNIEKMVFPKILTIEPVNICQNECIYCSMRLMDRKKGSMSLEIMEDIAKEASQYGASIRFGGFGEPLIHKNFVKLVEICKANNVRTSLFTNGRLLSENMMADFCKMGLDEIRFSGAGLDAQYHNAIRRKSNYERDFKEKILMAGRIRKNMNSPKPYFTIYTNVISYDMGQFEEQKEKYVSYYLNLVDKIDIDFTNFSRVKDLDCAKPYYLQQTINKEYKPCVTLYHKFIIHWNGDVFACDLPYNFEKEYFLGNLEEDNVTLYEMYHSEKIDQLRKKTQNLEHSDLNLCKNCYSNTVKYESLKNDYKKES